MGTIDDGHNLFRRLFGQRSASTPREYSAEELAAASPLERGRALQAAASGNRSAQRALRDFERAQAGGTPGGDQ